MQCLVLQRNSLMPRKKIIKERSAYPSAIDDMKQYYPDNLVLEIATMVNKDHDQDFIRYLNKALCSAATTFFIDQSYSDNALTKTELLDKYEKVGNTLKKLNALLGSFSVNDEDNNIYLNDLFQMKGMNGKNFYRRSQEALKALEYTTEKLSNSKDYSIFQNAISQKLHLALWLEAIDPFWRSQLKEYPFSGGHFQTNYKDQKGGSIDIIMKMIKPLMPNVLPTTIAEAFKEYRKRQKGRVPDIDLDTLSIRVIE